MSWVTFLWAMVASACLTLAAVHLPVWLRDRTAWPSLFFAMQCASTAWFAYCELALMHAQTIDAYASAMRLAHVAVLGFNIAAIGFVLLGPANAYQGARITSEVTPFSLTEQLKGRDCPATLNVTT
ncbi:hypothetical protein [Variovorax sp. GT1P44]|uniref:hypothetical protein n=1 Tax=Variovorax sp. GT1P44 TaxID=3443742 RepID=UPI003F48B754